MAGRVAKPLLFPYMDELTFQGRKVKSGRVVQPIDWEEWAQFAQSTPEGRALHRGINRSLLKDEYINPYLAYFTPKEAMKGLSPFLLPYKRGGDQSINRWLRIGEVPTRIAPEMRESHWDVDEQLAAIASIPKIAATLEARPSVRSEVYRGVTYRVGKTYDELGFGSTSLSEDVAASCGDQVLAIRSKSGKRVNPVRDDEKEVLFLPGTRFIRREDGMYEDMGVQQKPYVPSFQELKGLSRRHEDWMRGEEYTQLLGLSERYKAMRPEVGMALFDQPERKKTWASIDNAAVNNIAWLDKAMARGSYDPQMQQSIRANLPQSMATYQQAMKMLGMGG